MLLWWCVALETPWSWEWAPYPGVWIATAIPIIAYVVAVRKRPPIDRRRMLFFMLGMLAFWLASDWPLGVLGAGYLASAHMAQFLLYTLVCAPLLLMGTPEWLASRMPTVVRRSARWLGHSPLICAVLYNAILLITHSPGTVEVLRRSQVGSFAMDVVWVLAGLILWLPVLSPLPDGRLKAAWGQMLYLFGATALVAVIPASLLTFSTTPVYAIYELAPRIGGLTAREDQQIAGILMKLATIPVVWGTIGVLWFRWARQEAVRA
jgi:putative membrane protein